MKVDDIIEVEISGQGMDGEGVARHEGIVVFVPFTLIDEKVRCKVTFVKKNYAQAKVIKVLIPSSKRRVPPCKSYFRCGGCDYLHIMEKAHEELKTQAVVNNFAKIAGVDITVDEYVESSSFEGYRNKVQLPFGMVDGSVVVGYYRNKSHIIEPCDSCILHPQWANNFTKIVVNFANTHKISVYNERLRQGLLRHLVMRKIGDKVAITLVINGTSVPNVDKLIEALASSTVGFNLHYNVNRNDTNVIMGDKLITVHGEECLQGEVLGVKVNVNPLAFMQINDGIRDKMYIKACDYLANCARVVDLYSGIGITTNILATRCDNVYSIELVQEAVDNAKQLTVLNDNEYKITNICGDVSIELPKLWDKLRQIDKEQNQHNYSSDNDCNNCNVDNNNLSNVATRSNVQDGKKDTACSHGLVTADGNINSQSNIFDSKKRASNTFGILLDPPRKGCDTAVIEAIKSANPDLIVYISCNHATLARDYALLKDDYAITHFALYDMFPNTHHIETITCLTRKK